MMRMSARGRAELAGHEGVVPGPYFDSVNVWTYGVGHTAAAGDPNPANMPRGMPDDIDAAIDDVMALFAQDLNRYEARVNDAIKVPLKQHEFDALVSFDYNTGGVYRARLSKAINQQDPNASRHFMGWTKPASIVPRREKEKHLFETGIYSNVGAAVWNVDTSGRLRGVYKTIPIVDLMPTLPVNTPDPAEQPQGIIAAIVAAFLGIFGGKRT